MSLEDVARRARVSPATVSRVLNNISVVKSSTRTRVLRAIEELKYYPNAHARALAGGTSRTLGLIVSNLENPFFHDIFRVLEQEAHTHGYEVLVANTDYDSQWLNSSVRIMLGRRVAGLGLVVSEIDPGILAELEERKIRTVVYDVGSPRKGILSIKSNYRKGIERVSEYLRSLGHKRFAFVGHHTAPGPLGDRKRTFVEVMERYSPELQFTTVADSDDYAGGRRAVQQLFASKFHPTAILCVNDFMAVGVLRQLRELGIDVPGQVSVTGFDNITLSEVVYPALTTLHIPRDQIGREIFANLTAGKQPPRAQQEIVITPELVVRESTGRAPRRRVVDLVSMMRLSALVFFAFTVCAQDSLTVTIPTGQLRGGAAASGAVFKGIPFAAPPVGDLRWREPAPVKPWPGVRDATKFGSRCMQNGQDVSEDCLCLNVWTPEWPPKSRKPVMVWIHGGGNFAGASSEATFDGEAFARRGIVLVSANYRLGVFGFFAHPGLTAESPHHASGNYGLMDQIAALKWVRDNIARFGGNRGNVTIFGESAGSLDINVLMTSSLAKGLYARLIGESGPAVAPPRLADGEKKGLTVATGLKAESIKALRAISAEELQKATGQGLQFLGPLLGVVVDGWVLPRPPFQVFQSGQEHRIDLLLGSNARELSRPFFPVAGLKEGIQADFGPLAPRALETYGLAGSAEPPADPVLGTAMAQWATDSQFRCGTVAELVWHSHARNRSYEFQFSRVPPGRESAGAAHGSEIPYVFGTLNVAGRAPNAPKYDSTDSAVSDQMQQYWVNFAKTGDPNAGSLPKWPSFDPVSRAYMEFTADGPIAREGLRRAACDLFIEKVSAASR